LRAEGVFRGQDFFSLIDSIGVFTRNNLGISGTLINTFPDLPVSELLTTNLEAYRHYILGIEFNASRYYMTTELEDSSYYYFNRAVDLDPSFALAYYQHAKLNYTDQISNESARQKILQAERLANKLSEKRDFEIRILYNLIFGDIDRAITLANMRQQLQPYNHLILEDLMSIYGNTFMIEELNRIRKDYAKKNPNKSYKQNLLIHYYLFTGKPKKVLKMLEKSYYKNQTMENYGMVFDLIVTGIHLRDLVPAKRAVQNEIIKNPASEESLTRDLKLASTIINCMNTLDSLNLFSGTFRSEETEQIISSSIYKDYLYMSYPERYVTMFYPISDSIVVDKWRFNERTLKRNIQNEVTGIYQFNRLFGDSTFYWKQDTCISNALRILENNDIAKALQTFQIAYEQNPEHYYLANYLKHLDYKIGIGENEMIHFLKPYCGEYGAINLKMLDGNLYYETEGGISYKMLPISKNDFMVPSKLNCQVQTLIEGGNIFGLRVVYRGGGEERFSRISEQALASQN